jgi:cbb3-type cytochrome oxidase subunit 3
MVETVCGQLATREASIALSGIRRSPLETIAFPTASAGLSLGSVKEIDIGDTGHYTYRRVHGTFRHDWEMGRYPFDRQRLVIPIDETHFSAARLVFEPDTAGSFITPDIRDRLREWEISELTLSSGISEETSTYGLPNVQGARYARLEAVVRMERTQFLTFLKLTSGVFAGVFIAFLSFFYDPRDRSSFSNKLGLLVGVLFAVLLSLRTADISIGDTDQLTLVTEIHLLTLVFIVVIALLALRDRRRAERDLPVRHPDWSTLGVVGSLYVLAAAGLVARAAWV